MWSESDESRRELEMSITDLLAALQEKHPDDRAEGFVKILMYSDGSGKIYDGPIISDKGEPLLENVLFEFDGKEELAEWLDSGQIPEPTERE
jgi:hypothetical protein